jgi:hypothetical protein
VIAIVRFGLQNLHPRFKSGRRLQNLHTQRLGCELTVRVGAVVYDLNGIAAEAWEKMVSPAPRRPTPPPQ